MVEFVAEAGFGEEVDGGRGRGRRLPMTTAAIQAVQRRRRTTRPRRRKVRLRLDNGSMVTCTARSVSEGSGGFAGGGCEAASAAESGHAPAHRLDQKRFRNLRHAA